MTKLLKFKVLSLDIEFSDEKCKTAMHVYLYNALDVYSSMDWIIFYCLEVKK